MADPIKPANDGGAQPAAGALPIFYKDPRPLDPANFGKRGLKRGANFKFAAGFNTVPISLVEFQHVQKSYPIIFVGKPLAPAVVLGFAPNENLYVMPDGSWLEDCYVPSYVRRYPFVLAEVPGDDRLFLCADYEAETITDQKPDLMFFDGDKPTEVVDQALDFCRKFQEELMVTRDFCAKLEKFEMLKEVELRYTLPDGAQRSAGKVVSIDAAAFEKVADQDILDLRKQGTLPCAYFQQSSQANWSRLAYRKERLAQGK